MTTMTTNQTATGYLKWAVVDGKTGKVVRDSGAGWVHNLILNDGLNGITARCWADSFTYAICGTGTRPTSVDSGTVTASMAGGTITASSASFVANDIGAVVKWDDGTQAFITGYTSTTQASTNSAATASGHFVKYNTQDGKLDVESKRTNTYLAGVNNCGTVTSNNIFKLRRTFDFSVETAPITYTEVGFSWASSGNNTTFSRILLPTPVFVDYGHQLRVCYELQITVGPAIATAYTIPITGWEGTSGVGCIQNTSYLISTVNTSGSSVADYCYYEPYGIAKCIYNAWGLFISSVSTALAGFGSCIDRSTNTYAAFPYTGMTLGAYVANSFTRSVTAVMPSNLGNMSNVWAIGIGSASSSQYTFLFDGAHAKDSSHTLSVTYQASWSRDLA